MGILASSRRTETPDMTRHGRRRFLQAGLAGAGLGLLTGCGRLPFPPRSAPILPRVGNLSPGPPSSTGPTIEAWRRKLLELGWVDGQNVIIEYRYAENQIDRYPTLAAELVATRPDVIFTGGGMPAIRALQHATSTIPIVFHLTADPVELGLVTSYAAPGGNLTGIALDARINAKRLELLKETLPRLVRAAMLWSPGQQSQASAADVAARALGIDLLSLEVPDRAGLERALDAAASWPAEAFMTTAGPIFTQHVPFLVESAAAKRLPAMFPGREFGPAGGLMAYGPNLPGNFRQAATQIDKILRGARPADLPIEQPSTFDFPINLRTAQALGVTIPPSILQQATEIFQ
jgi:putative ABC transport system substrate-binding protein